MASRSCACGARASCSKANASDEAVVSCPATSAVKSSSRISSSAIGTAVAVAGGQQHRQHVVAVGVLAPALVDQREELGVDRFPVALEAAEATAAAEEPLCGREQGEGALAELEDRRHAVAQAIEPQALVEPEHGAQDDLERQALQARVQRDRLTGRPARDLRLGELLDQPGQALHAVAVEGGQQELALLHVRRLVEQDHGVRAHDRLEQAGSLAGVQDVRRRGEQLAQVGGIGEDDERRLAEQAQREARPVATPEALQVGRRPRPPADRLGDRGETGSRGQRRRHAARV